MQNSSACACKIVSLMNCTFSVNKQCEIQSLNKAMIIPQVTVFSACHVGVEKVVSKFLRNLCSHFQSIGSSTMSCRFPE